MKKLYLYIVLSALFFGSMEVALKLAGGALDPFQITFLRFLIGGLLLTPFAAHERRGMRAAGGEPLTPRLWLWVAFLGAVNVPFCMIFFQLGVLHSNAATAAVIFSCNPVFTMFFAHALTPDDKMNRRKALALAIGIAGLVFMIRPWDLQPGNTFLGAALSLAAAAVFALYGVLNAKTLVRVGTFTQTASSFVIGALILLALLPPLGRPIFAGFTDNLPILVYTSVVVTGGGYLFYFLALKKSSPSTAAIVFFLKPVIAPVFAVLVLAEQITWNMYCGIALILAASYILLFRKK
ncbi:MAG: DMT family transporter [Clostridiales Family XIII bacterium]|jgi:drug/metabolite transporter (DMT)-like permease|nr:DMT family transporter [Clostridiales Family XIII bacterium]